MNWKWISTVVIGTAIGWAVTRMVRSPKVKGGSIVRLEWMMNNRLFSRLLSRILTRQWAAR